MTQIKTIDVLGKEWFDKINGNSYFSATVTINYSLPSSKEYSIPIQYGYGNQYISAAKNRLMKANMPDIGNKSLWSYCKDNNIILRTSKKENCLKRDL